MKTEFTAPPPGFTFGCDPELFVRDDTGRHVTAEGLLPGTKAEPYKVPGGAIQVDGMAAEFNIDPVSTFEGFNGNITKVMNSLKKMLPRGYSLDCSPAVVFDEKAWNDAPEVAKILGCNPDYNAWTGSMNSPPDGDKTPRLRTASGHLHIGWTDDGEITDATFVSNCIDLVKQLDWYLGVNSILVDPDTTRRSLYGQAGACRFKSYGVEYRVLSNYWLKSTDSRLRVWKRMVTAVKQMRQNFYPEIAADFNELVIQSINTSSIAPALSESFYSPVVAI